MPNANSDGTTNTLVLPNHTAKRSRFQASLNILDIKTCHCCLPRPRPRPRPRPTLTPRPWQIRTIPRQNSNASPVQCLSETSFMSNIRIQSHTITYTRTLTRSHHLQEASDRSTRSHPEGYGGEDVKQVLIWECLQKLVYQTNLFFNLNYYFLRRVLNLRRLIIITRLN